MNIICLDEKFLYIHLLVLSLCRTKSELLVNYCPENKMEAHVILVFLLKKMLTNPLPDSCSIHEYIDPPSNGENNRTKNKSNINIIIKIFTRFLLILIFSLPSLRGIYRRFKNLRTPFNSNSN